jgi:2-keto-4-pentenoate hydratase
MSREKAERTASLLVEARRTRQWLAALPPECRPADEGEAYAAQEAVLRRLGAVGGWKTGAPSATSPASFAPILAAAIHPSPAQLPASELRLFGLELEIGFRIGKALPKRDKPYGREDVMAAIQSMHPTIEIVESRYVDLRAQDKLSALADNTSNGALVYGAAASGWEKADLSRPPGRLAIDGKVAVEVTSGNSGGDPLRLLAELATHCAKRGRALKPGDIVTTGSCTGLIFAKAGTRVSAEFDAFGKVEVSFPV